MSIMETITKQQALANFLEVEVTDTPWGLRVGEDTEYDVYTDEEADQVTLEYIKDMLWAFNPDFLASYTGLHKAVFEALAEGYETSNEAILALINTAGNIEEFAQECIDADGRGHFLSPYNGDEIELKNGYYAYRTN